MRKIFRIAKLELNLMFYSPIAWLVLVLFTIQTGITFFDLLYTQETSQQLGRPLSVLTKVLFAGDKGILATVQRNLYLYVPLLTMGLFSREFSSGSIKLLVSSPVTNVQIVLGKYFALLIYGLLLMGILSLFIIPAEIGIKDADLPFVIGGILGNYLLLCVYAAIGLFMSSLTSYQIVAAISTLAVLAFLNFIGTIGQQYDLVREITYWFSLNGRTNNFVNGLISTKDLVYFFVIMLMFLAFTYMRLEFSRLILSRSRKIMNYLGVVLVCVGIGYVSSMPVCNYYYDSTRFKDRTLTDTSQNILDLMDSKQDVEITSYVNILHYSAQYGTPLNRIDDQNHFEKYRRFIPEMKMNYIAYYDTVPYNRDTVLTLSEKAKNAASAYKFDFEKVLNPNQIRSEINLLPEHNRLVRFLSYNGKTTPLRMFDDILAYPGEREITAAFKRLLDDPVKIGILSGHGERNIQILDNSGFKVFMNGTNVRSSLINQGFDVFEVTGSAGHKLIDSIDVLVVSDPVEKIDSTVVNSISDYLLAGGDAIFTADPGNENLNHFFDLLGIEKLEGTLLEESEDFEMDLIQGKIPPVAEKLNIKFYDDAIVTLNKAMGLNLEKVQNTYEVTPLVITNIETVWSKIGPFDLGLERVKFDPSAEQKKAVPVIVALEKQFENNRQRIIVSGDSDFLSNSEMTRNNLRNVNASFATKVFSWLVDDKFPIKTSRPKALDTEITINRNQILVWKYVFVILLPILIAITGIYLLMRRKRF
ncbi:Gldg family protein [Robertkochia solimangrovi]|uniref:Gldg family protein n=1 Tax=Robertkochia solimangrovi TaxID=2213046 RepID=UPI00117C1A21|nr:Gldg family protein [Robertkochia solimangrovi]TRZ45190.1 ABC transporter [Robertkochia solimangrovi]